MIVIDDQELRISVRAVWTDGDFEIDETTDVYKAGALNWWLLEALNETGEAFELAPGGGIIARGPNTDIEGDVGFAMNLTFKSLSYPVPAKLKFDVITVDDTTGEEQDGPETVIIDLPHSDSEAEYGVGLPSAFQHKTVRNRRLYVGNLYHLG
jgi:hypothetical protein